MEFDFDNIKALALAADQNGDHHLTRPRDSNNCAANQRWVYAASPALFMELLKAKQQRDAALAVIEFVTDLAQNAENQEDAAYFLNWWNEGEFDALRREWPDAPDTIYIGVDPLHPETLK